MIQTANLDSVQSVFRTSATIRYAASSGYLIGQLSARRALGAPCLQQQLSIAHSFSIVFVMDQLRETLRPDTPRRTIIISTFGTRGDVQPFVGIACALQAVGHKVVLATSPLFKGWIEEYGLTWEGLILPDPKEAFSLCVAKGFFTLEFMRAVTQMFSPIVQNTAQGMLELAIKYKPDLICCTFSTIFCGVHVNEKIGTPCAILSYIPVGPTKKFFSPYALGPLRASATKSRLRNMLSFKMIEVLYSKLVQPWMNNMRKEWGLPPVKDFNSWKALQSTPTLSCYSPALLPPPKDWPLTYRQTSYWWLPPTDLTTIDARTKRTMDAVERFLALGSTPFYIGFGSVPLSDQEDVAKLTALVKEAIRLTGRRAIVATGWGAIDMKPTIDVISKSSSTSLNTQNGSDSITVQQSSEDDHSEIDSTATPPFLTTSPLSDIEYERMPANLFVLDAIPHDWMFVPGKLAAIVHHGGAGTTAYALRAAIPSVITPFFGDHFLWSQRLYEIGAGPKPLPYAKMTAKKLAKRIIQCCTDDSMRANVKRVAENMSKENGLADGVKAFEELCDNKGHWSDWRKSSALGPEWTRAHPAPKQ